MNEIFTETEKNFWIFIFSLFLGSIITFIALNQIKVIFGILLILGTGCITYVTLIWFIENILKIEVQR